MWKVHGGNEYSLCLAYNLQPCFYVYGDGTGTSYAGLLGAITLPVNRWSHLSAQRAGDALRMYVNGPGESERGVHRRRRQHHRPLAFRPVLLLWLPLLALQRADRPGRDQRPHPAPRPIYASIYIPESPTAGVCDVIRYFHNLRDAGPADPAFVEAEGEPGSLLFRGAFQGVETTIAIDPSTFPGLTENVDSFQACVTLAYDDGLVIELWGTFTEVAAQGHVFSARLLGPSPTVPRSGLREWAKRTEEINTRQGTHTCASVRVRGLPRSQDYELTVAGRVFALENKDGSFYAKGCSTTVFVPTVGGLYCNAGVGLLKLIAPPDDRALSAMLKDIERRKELAKTALVLRPRFFFGASVAGYRATIRELAAFVMLQTELDNRPSGIR